MLPNLRRSRCKGQSSTTSLVVSWWVRWWQEAQHSSSQSRVKMVSVLEAAAVLLRQGGMTVAAGVQMMVVQCRLVAAVGMELCIALLLQHLQHCLQ